MPNRVEFHRDNHYVPCVYLKQFAGTDGRIAVYRLLVEHENQAVWKPYYPNRIARQAHLYTRIAAGRESDEIERWLDREFEAPAGEALRKATSDEPLKPVEWECLARFLAAQDVRTPARLLEALSRWGQTLQQTLDRTLQDAVQKFEAAKRDGIALVGRSAPGSECIPIRITAEIQPDQEIGTLKTELVIGRGLWFSSMQHLLGKTLKHLESHKWTILHPPEGLTWFTSDDPVIRLNWLGEGKYTFDGGWGSKGTDIMLPLGPRHLLYARVGQQPPRRGTVLSRPEAETIRSFIAEHAHRMILAAEVDPEVARLRARVVDQCRFRDERGQWERWHAAQSEAERKYAEGPKQM